MDAEAATPAYEATMVPAPGPSPETTPVVSTVMTARSNVAQTGSTSSVSPSSFVTTPSSWTVLPTRMVSTAGEIATNTPPSPTTTGWSPTRG